MRKKHCKRLFSHNAMRLTWLCISSVNRKCYQLPLSLSWLFWPDCQNVKNAKLVPKQLNANRDFSFSLATPRFTKVPVDMIGVSGGVVSFVCQATGDPKPRVTWNKKGKRVNSQRIEVRLSMLARIQYISWIISHFCGISQFFRFNLKCLRSIHILASVGFSLCLILFWCLRCPFVVTQLAAVVLINV